MMNRSLGSILIIAGTSIGAGMLAMPLATAGVGFPTTLLILLILWFLMAYTALLLVEVYQYNNPNLGLDSLSRKYLGKFGQWITALAMLMLMYALTAAYISGAGDLLSSAINNLLNKPLPTQLGVIIFTLIGGGIVSIGISSVDAINRILFICKIIFFVIVLMLLRPHIQYNNLLELPIEQGLILSALPVIFTSFGFHGSVPSVVSYLNGDVKKLRQVFIIGSAIPLIVYILWQITTLGALSSGIFRNILAQDAGLSGLMSAVKEIVSSPLISISMNIFADLALATSFLGVTLGLFDYLADLFKINKSKSLGRLKISLITFIPPLGFALFYPKGFVMALSYASIALVLIALFIPALLVLQSRKQEKHSGYRVFGGIPALLLVALCGCFIIMIQILISLGILPLVN